MRQVVSLVKEGRVQYALMDDETGELTEFAQIMVPDHFGLQETAVLGTNIIGAIGLNGRAKGKGGPGRRALPPADQPSLLDQEPAELPAPKAKAKRPTYATGRAKPDPANKVGRYISGEEVLDMLSAVSEGVSAQRLAELVWYTTDGKHRQDEPVPRWVVRSVENRMNGYGMAARDKGTQPPFRVSYVAVVGVSGQVTKKQQKLYHPLRSETAASREEPRE